MALPHIVHASDGGERPAHDPAHRRGRILVLEYAEQPGLYTVILHSEAGTNIRANVGIGEAWRVAVKGGHHVEFKLTAVGAQPGPVVASFPTRPAEFETRHPADCPACSGLAAGTTARAVQAERARAKLAKQCL